MYRLGVEVCRRIKASPAGTPAALTAGTQADLAKQWMAVAQSLPRTGPAANLYSGRAFSLARDAAMLTATPLFIISAGLGLVEAETPLPEYEREIDTIQESIALANNPSLGLRRRYKKLIEPFVLTHFLDADRYPVRSKALSPLLHPSHKNAPAGAAGRKS